ncbi:MAG TPA: hypothetical protein VML55_26415, partial [Planctomycetaceae bacterium]|nr:hypothetical protein [Planctomycetaceae bacterium]
VLLTIDASEADEVGSRTSLLEKCVEQRLAGEGDPARHAAILDALNRLRSRNNPPNEIIADHELIVRYLLHGRLD